MTGLPPAGRRGKKKVASRGVFVPGALLDPGQVVDLRMPAPMVYGHWEDGSSGFSLDRRPGGIRPYGTPISAGGGAPLPPPRPAGGGRVNLVDLGVLSAYLARLNSTRRV